VNKGFPRPRFENWDKVTYPLPYTAKETSIAVLDDDRVAECLGDNLCIVCGEGVGDRCFAILKKSISDDFDLSVFAESGPFHEKCVKLTLFLCPHIKDKIDLFKTREVETDRLMEKVRGFWK
jgi:hypothetical protein